MKKFITIMLFTSCANRSTNYPTSLNELVKPATVIAIYPELKGATNEQRFKGYADGSIVLRGSDGKYLTLSSNFHDGAALINSLKIGDTLK